MSGKPSGKPIPHGTPSGYVYWKCRCDVCRAWRSTTAKVSRVSSEEVDRVRRWRATERGAAKRTEWRKNNRDKERAWVIQWALNNPERYALIQRASSARRRARERGASGYATVAQVVARMEYHGFRCVYCGGPFEHIDHVIPLGDGGTNFASNLVPSCQSCNQSKGCRRWMYGKQILRALPDAPRLDSVEEVSAFFEAQ